MLIFGFFITWKKKTLIIDRVAWMLFLLCFLIASVAAEKSTDVVKGRICIGSSGRMSVPQNREHHYRNLRDRFTNCTYVDGNLELTWLQSENFDLSFLQYIREVTGYVLISHVDVSRIVLPRLQIIRGRTLFKLNIQEAEFALMVTLSKMNSLEMPALRDILRGNVGFYNNYNLCYIKSIRWDEIISGQNASHYYVYDFKNAERECPPCHKNCIRGCWGEGADNCQKFSKIDCSPQCSQGRCFGPQPRDCCHINCAGGCNGPTASECLACSSVYDDGICSQECPPMQIYNPGTYAWEVNPNGKYAYGATCVKTCPEHLLKDNGACVKSCPSTKRAVNGECVPCEGPCPKTCKGVAVIHEQNIDSFRGCTVIEGSISILESTFKGFQQFDENYTSGAKIPSMNPNRLEVFSTLKEVTGYINIQGYHESFTNLTCFRNLEIIGGRELTQSYFASLYIVKTSLKFLGLTSLKKILSGGVAILENKHLCYTEGIDWKKVKKSVEHGSLLQNNKKFEECQKDKEVCNSECSSEGCWGPGSDRCISCAHFQYSSRCIPSCDAIPGLYKANLTHCIPCHEECASVCFGPGPDNCTICKHVRDGSTCVSSCPENKYNNSGECKPCHSNCKDKCFGPENTISKNGCVSCHKAIHNGDKIENCMRSNESCPLGYYQEWYVPSEHYLKANSGMAICRPCHPRCKKCTGYGFDETTCLECVNYKRGSTCEDECPPNSYADNVTQRCIQCSSECIECYGPDSTHCLSCKNLKVYLSGGPNSNSSSFNCTSSCPPEFPHKMLAEDDTEPYCSVDAPRATLQSLDNKQWPPLVVALIFIVGLFCIFAYLAFYQWQRRKEKQSALKMTMMLTGIDDSQPLKPSNVKPNLAKLRIVTENELRKGKLLGSGAFGTVYRGKWFPKEENMENKKGIPVAMKVLREPTVVNTSKQFLEEAYIMASVSHPNLLSLLAVCMTSEMMLITQLMPLGCLLDYVRNHNRRIPLQLFFTWCTQIAKGMAYLEEMRLVHRDLAARNVLLFRPDAVKITDFGLAKLLDTNEESYRADDGKMPIKWLAMECIEQKIFTSKSDVWAYGVTIWEIFTYGGKPWEHVDAKDLPEQLKKGQRLPVPPICTIDVQCVMLSCWFPNPEERPTFKELVDKFAKFSQDPKRYLYFPQDDKRILSLTAENYDTSVDSEEYLQPKNQMPGCSNMIGIPISDSPLPHMQHRDMLRFAIMDHGPGRAFVVKESDSSDELGGRSSRHEVQLGSLKLDLPLDDDDYLIPSPQQGNTASSVAYMDLISDAKQSDENQNATRIGLPKYNVDFTPSHVCVDNPEYHLMSTEQKLGIPQLRQLQHRSSEEDSSDHEYYNDFDRLQRELQPLRRNTETTV